MSNQQDFDISAEVEKYFDDTSIPVDGKPTFVLLMGGICTDKTTARKEYFSTGYVLLDAAEIFLNLCNGEFFQLGEAYEEELNAIGNLIAQRAIRERRNIITEIVGMSEEEPLLLLKALDAAGYEVNLNRCACDKELTWQRNVEVIRNENQTSGEDDEDWLILRFLENNFTDHDEVRQWLLRHHIPYRKFSDHNWGAYPQPADVKDAEQSVRLAHARQTDKAGADYIEHPLRVAQSFSQENVPNDDYERCRENNNLQMIALLHDTLEDN